MSPPVLQQMSKLQNINVIHRPGKHREKVENNEPEIKGEQMSSLYLPLLPMFWIKKAIKGRAASPACFLQ